MTNKGDRELKWRRFKKGKRCSHVYWGLYKLMTPRFKIRIIDGRKYFCTDYKCQIIGCNHWEKNWFKHVLKNKRKTKAYQNSTQSRGSRHQTGGKA